VLNRFLFLILFLSSVVSFAQQKYFVYFKDKGNIPKNSLLKTASAAFSGVKYLTDKSIERRKKTMGEENYINFDDIPVLTSYKDQLVMSGVRIDKTLNWFNAVSCYLNESQYEKIKLLSFVEKIEPVRTLNVKQDSETGFELSSLSYPAYHYFDASGFDYGISLTQNKLSDIPKAHDAGFNGNGVLIGILDTGFELSSPSLTHIKLIAQHDFVFNDGITSNESNDALTQHDHGTAVISIMAGFDQGYLIGPAYNASFLLAKTENVISETHVEEDNYAAALEWMEAQGVQITSSSLGYNNFDAGETSYTYSNMDGKTAISTKAAEKAFERGVVVLSAAGNDGAATWHYIGAPADGMNTIAVGAVTPENEVASFSSRGPTYDGRIKPDICAQGTDVVHANPLSGLFTSGGGTSYATPIAAGIAALLLQANPYLTNVQMRNILLQAGDNIKSPDNNRGYGLLSAVRALNLPNLSKDNNVFRINKMFIGVEGITTGSVKFNYYVNSVLQNPINAVYDGVNRYTVSIPLLNAGDVVKFTFSYNTVEGLITEPVSNYFEFTYGDMLVYDKSYGAKIQFPESFTLYQNFPNPFTNETKIRFDLTAESQVSVDIFNILGQSVKTLFAGRLSGGQKTITWNGRYDNGVKCPSGVYIIRVITDGKTSVKKAVLIK
jgi:hypothetical protein